MTTHDTQDTHIIAGIDYSITSPAIWINDTGFAFGNRKRQGVYDLGTYKLHIDAYPNHQNDDERFSKLAEWAIGILIDHNVDHVMLEDYAYNATGRSVFQTGECTGTLKQALRAAHIDYERVSPTAVKKRAVNGKADKHMMVDAFQRETGIDLFTVLGVNRMAKTIAAPVTDLCDAYWLSRMDSCRDID